MNGAASVQEGAVRAPAPDRVSRLFLLDECPIDRPCPSQVRRTCLRLPRGHGHDWSALADDAIARYRAAPDRTRVLLVGHSRGGDAVMAMAWRLYSANVPVALAVAFDPTRAVRSRNTPGRFVVAKSARRLTARCCGSAATLGIPLSPGLGEAKIIRGTTSVRSGSIGSPGAS